MTAFGAGDIRVWAIFHHYHPNFAGAAVQGHRVLSQLASQGYTVYVLAAADLLAADLGGQEINRDGLIIRYIPLIRSRRWQIFDKSPFLSKVAKFLNSVASSFSLNMRIAYTIVRQGQPGDIVQFYSITEFSFIVVWISRIAGMHPIIRLTLLGSDSPEPLRWNIRSILSILKQVSFEGAEAIVSISSALTESCWVAGISADKVFQIPNGVDLTKFSPLNDQERILMRSALGLSSCNRYIVFVGAAIERKGIDVLVDAFIQIAQHFDDVDLLLVGSNDFSDLARYPSSRARLLAKLKRQLAANDCSDRVHWLGEQDNVHEYLQVADLFCLPTRREGLGTVIAEAMAVGLPVVVTRLEGVTTDLVHSEKEGILLVDHNPNNYFLAFCQLLNNDASARVMGYEARRRVESDFDLALITGEYAGLYRDVADVGHV